MITIGTYTVSLEDPIVWVSAAAAVLFLLLIRAGLRGRRAKDPVLGQLEEFEGAIRALNDGQNQLHGGLSHVAESQAASLTRVLETMERRLGEVSQNVGENLGSSAQRTARSLGDLHQRLQAIDNAQTRIEKLSGDVLGLQDILSNKQTRGAFGEIQLREIVGRALPPDAARFQVTLSNGSRADCVIDLPNPPGPIAIDAKFPLEPYEALVNAKSKQEVTLAQRQMRTAVRAHLRAISEKYIIDGETAEGALMFLPSEAVYSELHARFGDMVREGFDMRVWIVSPTTCMATLHTLRAVLKDTKLRAEAHKIRKELGLLYRDVERLSTRVGNLDRHFSQAQRDVEEIQISADRAHTRARKLESVDFFEPDATESVESSTPDLKLKAGE